MGPRIEIKEKKQTRLEAFLAEQGTLTPVDRFSDLHDRGAAPRQEKFYKELIPGRPPNPGQQYAFEVNLDSCSGCKACVTGCHSRNGLDEGETWRAVGLIQGRKTAAESDPHPSGRVRADPVEDSASLAFSSPSFYQQNITAACHHCVEPACLTGCPVDAYEKDPVTGIVKHLDDQCIGCQYCTYKCPYLVPQYNKKRGIVRKCDMCTDRLQEGEAPACVQSCPNEAIRITLVDVLDAKIQPGKHFQIPSSPDPRYTQPTTRYVSSKKIPANALGADHGAVKPQHPEYPLVFMLVLTQAAAGAFSLLPFVGNAGLRWGSAVAAAVGVAGLAVAMLHLGRPLYAFRVVVGLRHSWLSREAVVFGLFAKLALLSAALAWRPVWEPHMPAMLVLPEWVKGAGFLRGVLSSTALAGWAGVFCSVMIYRDTPRAWWASRATAFKFFHTRGSLGPPLWGLAGAGRPLFFALAVAAGLTKGLVELGVLRHLKDETFTPLRKTALLLTGPLK
ncbi:MAG: DmsC/YnfH family molybdoenzyme membrane anchor subunit, partial [Elusimicrobiota bacterium]